MSPGKSAKKTMKMYYRVTQKTPSLSAGRM